MKFSDHSIAIGDREKKIIESLVKVHGREIAFLANNAMWMQILLNLNSHMALAMLKYIEDGVARSAAREELEKMAADFFLISQSTHASLCTDFEVDAREVLEVSKHFHQLMFDALNAHRRKE